MSALVLWKKLTENDFNAMNGDASPHGDGGGARHIALGVSNQRFPIADFLGRRKGTVKLPTQGGDHESGELVFSSNPTRRNGEWLISDQFQHRHPAWTVSAGFPTVYDSENPPYVLVFRIGSTTHVRLMLLSDLQELSENALPAGMLEKPKGIQSASRAFLIALNIPFDSPLDAYNVELNDPLGEKFDPNDTEDGRQRILASIVRRQGQRDFRRKLFNAYDKQCAISRCRIIWVLEAAHITPYRGKRTNAVSNGLLLRADIHTLFDLALIAISPESLRIHVSTRIDDESYLGLRGRSLFVPRHEKLIPNIEAITKHFRQFERQEST